MSDNYTERPPAQTLGELDLHLGYVQRQLAQLVAAMPQMATKADIADLAKRLDGYATKDELRALRERADSLEARLDKESIPNTLTLWADRIKAWGAAVAVIAAAAVLIAKAMGRLQ